MRTEDLQRRFDLTSFELEAFRNALGGHFVTQRGRMVNRGGILRHEYVEEPEVSRNIVTNEGLDSVLDVYLNAATQITVWYLTTFTDNITPLATHTAAAPGTTEITTTNVAESVRETYNANAASGQSIDNVAGPVAQYIADNTHTQYGAQLFGGGTSAFGNTGGKLWASSLFGAQKDMVALDTIDITYTFTAADV